MAHAFLKYGVDRNTITQTSAIAEMAIAALEEYEQLVQQLKGRKLIDIAKQCKESVEADEAILKKVQQLKEIQANKKTLKSFASCRHLYCHKVIK